MLRWWTVQIDADGPNPSFPSGMIFPLLYLPVPCRYSKENHPAFLTAGQVPPCNSDFNMIPCINHSWEGVLRESFVRWHGDKIWPANPLWYVCCTQLYLCIYDIYNFNTHISIYIYIYIGKEYGFTLLSRSKQACYLRTRKLKPSLYWTLKEKRQPLDIRVQQ